MKWIIPFSVTFSLSVLLCFGQNKNPLFVVTVNGKQGFIDRNGKVVIAPKFVQCSGTTKFVEGLAVVCTAESDKAGFIDQTGKFVINQAYDGARNFSEGLAAIQFGERGLHDSGDYRTGFIDKTGRLVIEPIFRKAEDFTEGLSAVEKDGKSGFIDKSGKVVIPLQYDYAFSFSEGLAAVFVNGMYGFIDKTGTLVIRPQFKYASRFSDGLACVKAGGSVRRPYPYSTHIEEYEMGKANYRYAFIDRNGQIIHEFAANHAGSFSEGLASVQTEKGYGFIRKDGTFAIPPNLSGMFSGTPHFSEMLSLIAFNDGRIGFIDKKGNVAISTKFKYASDFENGLAEVCENVINTCGYIDKTGKVIWKPTK